jgi:hypothetical protein
LFRSLGVVKDGPTLDKWTHEAYKQEEERKWREDTYFTSSFHASSYPGGEKNCRCRALYKLMNIPELEPISPRGIGVMGVGKAVEEQIVERWAKMGILLGPQPPKQLKIEFEDLWLSGYLDAVLDLRPEWNYVLPVEIKTKKNKVIEYMKVGGQSYDEQHYYQLQAYILWCIRNHREMGWDKLDLMPAQGGIIYYVSREDPRNTHEFYIEFDETLAREAADKLKYWKQCFLDDVLPERPKDMKWLDPACCKWNPYKKLCKADYKEGIVKLSESNAVKFAKEHNPSYNVEDIKKKVRERWEIKQLSLF